MTETYSSKVVFASTPEQVSKLLQLDETNSEQWGPEDLRAMVRHRMATPLQFDLAGLELSELQKRTAAAFLTEASGSGIRTFGDLFQTPHPPLELLKLAQKFFKQNVARYTKGSPDQKVAYLFYLLSIVVAKIRNGKEISNLSRDELLHNVQSMMKRPWVDELTRELLAAGRRRISSAENQ